MPSPPDGRHFGPRAGTIPATRVTGLDVAVFSRERMNVTLAEREEERDDVAHLLE